MDTKILNFATLPSTIEDFSNGVLSFLGTMSAVFVLYLVYPQSVLIFIAFGIALFTHTHIILVVVYGAFVFYVASHMMYIIAVVASLAGVLLIATDLSNEIALIIASVVMIPAMPTLFIPFSTP